MNAITGIENLISQPKILNTPYWTAYQDTDKDSNKVRSTVDFENLTIEESEKHLRELVNMLSESGCNLIFRFYSTNDAGKIVVNKGFYTVKFYQPGRNGMSPSASVGIGATPEDIDSRIEKAIIQAQEKWQRDQELKQLRDENQSLKKEIKEAAPTPFERVIGRLEPVLDVIIENAIPMNAKNAATAVAGPQTEDEAQKRIEAALTIIADGEENPVELFEKLAALKKNSPAKYNMAKSML